MTAVLLVLLASLLLAGVVLGYVAFPHRRQPIPGAPPQVVEKVAAAEQRLGLTGESSPHGLLGSRERDRRARARFERVEQRIVGTLRPSNRPRSTGPRDAARARASARSRERAGHGR